MSNFSIVRYFPQGIVYFLAKKEKNGDEWYDIIILWYTLHPINHIWNIHLPGEKSSKKHEQMTSPLMPNTCTERGHEAQYKKWRAGWCALMKIIYFSMGTFFTSRYSLLEERKGYLFWDVFWTRWKKWLLQETFTSAHTTPRGPHSQHRARQHITCVLIIS